jgi:hypothetical protein
MPIRPGRLGLHAEPLDQPRALDLKLFKPSNFRNRVGRGVLRAAAGGSCQARAIAALSRILAQSSRARHGLIQSAAR